LLLWFALPYVTRSWAIFERSRETSGIPAVFLLKTLILLFVLLMLLQGISQAIRAAHTLRGGA
jgi:TRAP-type mannitol/chloroaromatic compound transport system permease small subunit